MTTEATESSQQPQAPVMEVAEVHRVLEGMEAGLGLRETALTWLEG